ncbi:MAG: class I SAM-dependent methyltransferase [Bacteroidia bacterium]
MGNNDDYLTITKDYYDNRLGKEHGHDNSHMEDWFRWEAIESVIKKQLRSTSTALTILDYGCGTGWLSNLLSKYARVTGIDISERAIQSATKKYNHIRFLSFDASSKELPELQGEKFDIIVSSEVIEHVQDQKNYINNIMQLLKPNGFLVLTTPNGEWKKQYFYKDRSEWGQPFEFWLTSKEIKNLIPENLHAVQVRSFNSNGLLQLKSFGIFNLIGNRFILKGIKILRLQKLYYKILDNSGFGLYLILTGKNGI